MRNKEKGQTVVGRALRGGSWNNQSDNLRCAARDNDNPWNNWNNNGFRVVCAFSPNHTYRVPMPYVGTQDLNQVPVFQGIPDCCSGMTCGPFSRGHASPR
jgi:hypothetical protein